MRTEQATLILAFFLGSPRRFRSYELSKAAKQLLITIQHVLETYEKQTESSNYQELLAQVNQAYRMLEAEPPKASVEDLGNRKHPLVLACTNPSPRAETDAWKAFLNELRKKT